MNGSTPFKAYFFSLIISFEWLGLIYMIYPNWPGLIYIWILTLIIWTSISNGTFIFFSRMFLQCGKVAPDFYLLRNRDGCKIWNLLPVNCLFQLLSIYFNYYQIIKLNYFTLNWYLHFKYSLKLNPILWTFFYFLPFWYL